MVWVAVLFIICVAGFAINLAIAIRMQNAVNAGSPKSERLVWYGMLGSDWRRILQKHKSRFPDSHLRRWYFLSAVILVVAFLLMGAAAKLSHS